MLFQLDATMPVFVISFLVFMWLLNEIMLKPVGAAIEKRAQLIEANSESGKQARVNAQLLLDGYEANLLKVRTDAQAVIAKATDAASQARQVAIERVSREGQSKLDKAKAEIASEREKLIDELVSQEKELVESITQKVLDDASVRVSMDDSQVRKTLKES